MDFYLNVFLESAHAASIIPLYSSGATFYAMRSFGGFNLPLAAMLAVFGSALGALFNFALGYGLLFLYRKKNIKFMSNEKYSRASRWFFKYGIVLLPLSWLPFFNFLVVAAGFLGVRARVALPLVILGQALYFGYYTFY
jgi:membrane protein YqaA with SNARE-associated domain